MTHRNATKEKNIITFEKEENGKKRVIYLDINTAILYGKKGQAYHHRPFNLTDWDYFSRHDNFVISEAAHLIYRTNDVSSLKIKATLLSLIDRLFSLGGKYCISRFNFTDGSVDLISKNFKEYIKFIDEGNVANVQNFQRRISAKQIQQINGQLYAEMQNAPIEQQQLLLDLYKDYNLNDKELSAYWYYIHRGYISALEPVFGRNFQKQLLSHYISLCRALDMTPVKDKNFLKILNEAQTEYNLRKDEIDKKQLKLHYDKHSEAWNFEYGEFTIIIPKNGEDIIREGRLMHHCVGKYTKSVIAGETYIVFVRRTIDPDTPYITCQVTTEGDIRQYYRAYDTLISDLDDIEFKKLFQKHLRQVWNS